jgi:hypothetical protein
MAEVIHVFDGALVSDTVAYRAQVSGRPAGNIWEGWIEFVASDGRTYRTSRETTQPNRDALAYWATGISTTYLEGALDRALKPTRLATRDVPAAPMFDGPAPPIEWEGEPTVDRAVLDPFAVGAKGEELLRRELGALADWHLRNIIRAYNLADPETDLEALAEAELIELIVGAVQPV